VTRRRVLGLVVILAAAVSGGVGVTRHLSATAPQKVAAEPALEPVITPTTPICSSPSRLMQWPAANPVWEFCFISPYYSSGANGAGLEIHDVYYNGHLVFKRAHAPILNVLYAPGGCGCYRDWSDQERAFQANNILIAPGVGGNGYAEPTVPPVTACDNSGYDTSGFTGVAAEKLADRLILTTQLQAGWYRYMMKWMFYLDGRIRPLMGFGAVRTSSCLNYNHTHHNYWRFDFDIDGAANDRVYEQRQGRLGPEVEGDPQGIEMLQEALRQTNNPGLAWIVRDSVTGRGYRVSPGPHDEVPADSFAVGDVWLLRYNAAQIDDAGQPGPACAIKFNNYLNGEKLRDQDVVLWYRGGAFHAGYDLDDCHQVGPILEPVGNWAPTPAAAARATPAKKDRE